jgi:hypothetical protein
MLPNVRIPRVGAAQPWVRTTTYGEWFGNNYDPVAQNDQFVALVNRINGGVGVRLDRWSLASMMRVDTQNLVDLDRTTPLCDRDDNGVVSDAELSECVYRGDARLERFMVRADIDRVRLTAGDFNVGFARGLGLSARKIDEIGVDATIKGGRVDLRTKPVRLTLLGGLANRQNSDFATRQLLEDPGYTAARCDSRSGVLARDSIGNRVWSTCSDAVAGAQIQARLPAKIRVGAHYEYVGFGERLSSYDESVHLAGGSIERAQIAKLWDAYLGATGLLRNADLRRDPALADASYEGLALYTANVFGFGPRAHATTILVEGKLYRDYLVALTAQRLIYVEAPTLEREDQQVPGISNAAGGRVRVDHTLGDRGLTVFGNAMAYAFAEGVREDMFSRDEGFYALHPYAGLRWTKPGTSLGVQVSGGYRYERHLEAATPDDLPFRRKFPHAEFYVVVPVGKAGGFSHSLSVRGEGRWETKQVSGGGEDNRFAFGNVVLGYAMAPHLSVAFIGGFSTEFPGLTREPILQPKPCAVDSTGAELCLRKPHLWPGAEVRWNFMASSFLRVFAGRQVGGRICVNGSCRLLPDFEGVRAELVLGF